nr:MAG TPA: PKD-like domain [Bacteriophage sp.]
MLASYQSNIGNLGEVAFQWYVDGVSIEGANERVLQVLQAGEYVVAVLPHTSEGEV